MNKDQIKVKRIEKGTTTFFTIKGENVYDAYGKNKVYCSCTGNTVQTATPMQYNETDGVYCPNCHIKKVEILQTYKEWKAEKDEKERKNKEEKLQNLHLVLVGEDWECGFKYYGLSTTIDYDDWLKVKQYFRYHKKGWSRGQELEWLGFEPNGWLTQQPLKVEEILLKQGLIQPHNTIEAIKKRQELEKQKKELERAKKQKERKALKEKIDAIDKKISQAFKESVRELSDSEAYKHFFNPTFGKGNVVNYTITDDEIIKCRNMGDFKYGLAIPYIEDIANAIKEFYKLNEKMWNYY